MSTLTVEFSGQDGIDASNQSNALIVEKPFFFYHLSHFNVLISQQ